MKIDLSKLGVTPGEWIPGKDGQSVITTDKELCHKMKNEREYGESSFRHYGGEVVCESIHEKDKVLVCSSKELLKEMILIVVESEKALQTMRESTPEISRLIKSDADEIMDHRIKLIEKALPGFKWKEIKKLAIKD